MKKQYVNMRQKGNYPVQWFYNYFIEQGGGKIDLNTFAHLFNFMNLQEVLNFLDGKFELTKLEDKDGKLIKIVE